MDNSTSHSFRQDLILLSGSDLLGGTFTSQVPLARFAKLDFTGSSDLKSFGDAFMRLSHVVEKTLDYIV